MNLSSINYPPIRQSASIAVTAIVLFFLPLGGYGQQKEKARAADKVKLEATLPEATVLAKFSAATYEVVPFKVQVELDNPTGKRANVSILNNERHYLYNENFTAKHYHRVFNFNEILPGAYTLRFLGHKNTVSRRFLVEENYSRNILLANEKLHVANDLIASFHVKGDNKVDLHLDNLGKEMVRIVVTDEKGRVVYQMNDRDRKVLKTFNMALMQDGNYTVTVKSKTDTIQQAFQIKSGTERTFAWLDRRGRPVKADVALKAGEGGENYITVRNR